MADINLLDITSDYIFKLVFGREENKDMLISLLNAIFKGNPHVEDITLQNSEISKILKNNKTVHLDVRAKIGEKSTWMSKFSAETPEILSIEESII